MTLTLAAGTLDTIRVLTQGINKSDFAEAPGGTCTLGRTYLAGQTCTVNLAFNPLYPGERRGAIVLLARNGPPLAQQFVSAQAVGSVNVFLPGIMSTVAGNQNWIYAGDGQPATQTNIFLPFGLAIDAAGNLYLADSSNNRIRKVDASTGNMATVAGNGNIGATGDGAQATAASLSSPSSIVLDPAGNLYFADSGNNAVRRVDAVTGLITTVAGTLNQHGYTGDHGTATAATLNTPNGLALDASGNLYLADTGNHVIRRVDAATSIITTVAGTGAAGFNGDSQLATKAQLNSPWSVYVASTGELYIADQNNHRVRLISAAGMITTISGTGTAGFIGDKGPAAQAQLNSPASVALDVAGNLYIADSGNNRIRKISAKDGSISTIAGVDGESFSGDGGPADQASLYGPYTLVLSGASDLFIADVFHNRIRKITVNQATLKFPAIRVGRVSAPKVQTLENDGNAPLHFNAIAGISNSKVDDASICSLTAPLAPLATCDTSVDFAPTLTGDPVVGKLALTSDAGNGPGLILPTGIVLDIDPTTLTLASSLNPGLTGMNITFTVNATSAGTTPTGTVTFSDVFGLTTTTLGTAILSSGTASLPVTTLAAGVHSILATYSGDSSNAAATTLALLETIKDAQPGTVTTLASSASLIDAGSSLVLTANVATKTQGSGIYAVAGTVSFMDGITLLGTATLDAGTATLDHATAMFSCSSLAVGSHSITAVYVGNTNELPSTSAPIVQIVRLATTTLKLATGSNPTLSGAALRLTASATSTGGTPGGIVNFFAGANQVGSAPLNIQGVAVLQLASAQWLPGTYALKATYPGDAANSAVTSQPVAEVITLATTTITLASSLNPAGLGAHVLFTATASSNGGTPGGSITFSDGNSLLGSATLNAASTASFSTTSLAIGNHPIIATYAGDPYDTASTSAPLAEQVNAATVAVTLTSSHTPSLFADPVTLTANVSGSGSVPAGSVIFFDGATPMSTVPVGAGGQATFTTSALVIGSHTLTAQYSGDANHRSITSTSVNQPVLQSTTVALQSASSHVIAGLPITLRVTVSGTSNQPGAPQPGGSITLSDANKFLSTLAVDASGQATWTGSLSVGSHTLTAAYSGDKDDAPSNASPLPMLVDIATTATTLTVSPNPAAFGSPITLSVAVTSNGVTPTGTVIFLDGAVTLIGLPLDANGTASLTLSALAPGIHALTALYSGNPNNSPSQSLAVSEQIVLHTALALTSNANPALLGDPVTLTLTAANGTGTPPTGMLFLSDNGASLGLIALVNGTATVTLPNATLGAHTLLASYAGDNNNGPASAQPLTLSVTLRPSTTSLTATSSALAAGQQLILVSVVQVRGAQPATGNVTFQAGSTVLGKVAISPAGVATLTLNPPSGTLSITAQFSGDALYASSTSTPVNVTVGPPDAFTLTPTPPTISLSSGAHTDVKLALASNPAFKDTLSFGCAGLPQFATCQFSATSLALTPGLPQALTVTVETGNPLGAGALAALPLGSLLCFALRRRRKYLQHLALAAILATIALSTSGCATQFAQSTTPAGEYNFQIVGTGQTTGATQSATVHLTVSK